MNPQMQQGFNNDLEADMMMDRVKHRPADYYNFQVQPNPTQMIPSN